MQVVGNDLHVTAIVGAKELKSQGSDLGIDADWVDTTPRPAKSNTVGGCCLTYSSHAF